MREKGIRKIMLGVLGGGICKFGMLGCYPLVPAYFVALYLEEVTGWYVYAMFFAGMFFFLPVMMAIKYLIAMVTIAAFVKLIQWVQPSCKTWIAGSAAGGICILLSLGGQALSLKDQLAVPVMLLEGLFVTGAAVLFHRAIHSVLEFAFFVEKDELEEAAKDEKLLTYAQSFNGLSEIFKTMSSPKKQFTSEELGQIQNELTAKMCTSCDCCAVCWENETTPLVGIISRMIASILKRGFPSQEDEKSLKKYCRKSKDMVEEAVGVFERATLNRSWYNRLLENRKVIAEQLDAMAYIMEDCAAEQKQVDAREHRKLSELRYLAKEEGILIDAMHLSELESGRYQLEVKMHSRQGGCIAVREFVRLASSALKRKMRISQDARMFLTKEPNSFLLLEDTRFLNTQGIAKVKKDGEQVSGDNFSFLELENGTFVMSLSDGMGSGMVASKESELVIDLMERFLQAGFSIETSIRMMNSAMVLKGEQNLYSTIDLCAVNLYTGKLGIYKIGAAATFLKRKDGVECIFSTNLPVGAQQGVEIEKTTRQLEDGDFLVMVTDGVLEYLHVPQPEETMREMIESISTNHAGVLAKRIIERVMLFTAGKVPDDMTVLTTCLWEK